MDFINGCFEFGLSLFILMNIRQAYRDKLVKGIWWPMVGFTTAWGYWNLVYYPSIEQWWSLTGGIFVVALNTVWLSQLIYYRNNT